jgi:hypothetical protein
MSYADRRRSPRVEIPTRRDIPLKVRDISLGGCSVESTVPFAANAVHSLTLEVGDGSLLVIRAKVCHTRRETTPDGHVVYVTGLEFTDAEGTQAATPADTGVDLQTDLPFAAPDA